MAFDRLDPNRDLILRLQTEGQTLTGIADELSRLKGIETTPATVSRFLKAIGKPQRSRELSPEEERSLDVAAVLAELVAEVRGRSDEQRAAIETLAGKVAALSADVTQLEQRIPVPAPPAPPPVPPDVVRRIWLRAFGVALTVVGAAGVVVWLVAIR